MKIEKELAKLACERDTVLTVGVFDGVHLGHRRLITALKGEAKAMGLTNGVVTFHCHPQEVLSPQARIPYLTTLEERVELLKGLGVELIAILPFTSELAQLSAREFLTILQRHLKMRGLVIGPDFALGRGREGDARLLRTLGEEMGFTLREIPHMKLDGEEISSTGIRSALSLGDVEKVNRLLGRNFTLAGEVTPGVGQSGSLGFPTANLNLDSNRALPADGVYATKTYVGNRVYHSATNIGGSSTFGRLSAPKRPTANEQIVETYLLDFHNHLLRRELKVEFLKRLRGERHFTSPEEFRRQINLDIRQAKEVLGK